MQRLEQELADRERVDARDIVDQARLRELERDMDYFSGMYAAVQENLREVLGRDGELTAENEGIERALLISRAVGEVWRVRFEGAEREIEVLRGALEGLQLRMGMGGRM